VSSSHCSSDVGFDMEFRCGVWLSCVNLKKVPIIVEKFNWFIYIFAMPVYIVFGSIVFVGSPLYISFDIC
jgi:hypothetical protein